MKKTLSLILSLTFICLMFTPMLPMMTGTASAEEFEEERGAELTEGCTIQVNEKYYLNFAPDYGTIKLNFTPAASGTYRVLLKFGYNSQFEIKDKTTGKVESGFITFNEFRGKDYQDFELTAKHTYYITFIGGNGEPSENSSEIEFIVKSVHSHSDKNNDNICDSCGYKTEYLTPNAKTKIVTDSDDTAYYLIKLDKANKFYLNYYGSTGSEVTLYDSDNNIIETNEVYGDHTAMEYDFAADTLYRLKIVGKAALKNNEICLEAPIKDCTALYTRTLYYETENYFEYIKNADGSIAEIKVPVEFIAYDTTSNYLSSMGGDGSSGLMGKFTDTLEEYGGDYTFTVSQEIDENGKLAVGTHKAKLVYRTGEKEYISEFDVVIEHNPVKSVEYIPAKEFTVIENEDGWFDEDTGVFIYNLRGNQGDKLIVEYADGTKESFTYSIYAFAFFNDAKSGWDYAIDMSESESNYADGFCARESQELSPWLPGKENTMIIRYYGCEVLVPVTVLPGEHSDDDDDIIEDDTPEEPTEPVVDIIYGDLDASGGITAADARLALRASVGLEDYTEEDKFAVCDVDCDGIISAADARLILRVAVGLEKQEILGK